MSIYDVNMISTKEAEGGDGVVGVSDSSSSSSFENLSDLISQLPLIHVKKGLSKYYKGKSQSFTSLADVATINDLVKRKSRLKPFKRPGGLLIRRHNKVYSLNVTVSSMKATRTSSPSGHSNSKPAFKPFM